MTAVAKLATSTPVVTNEALIQRLACLSAEFGAGIAAKIQEARQIWGLIPSAPSREEALSALVKIHDIVYTLAGAGKSFGFPYISTAAAPLDGLFRLVSEQTESGYADTLSTEEIAQIETLILALEDAASMPGHAIDLDDLISAPPAAEATQRTTSVIVLAGASEPDNAHMCALEDYGYRVLIIKTAQEIPIEFARGERGVVLADISKGDEHLALMRRNIALAHLPLILCSDQTGFAARLKAVRHGAETFLAKPFELEQLVDQVARLEESDYEHPSRVVIAEDDGPLSSFYQATLDHAGMETRVVRQPSKLLDMLS